METKKIIKTLKVVYSALLMIVILGCNNKIWCFEQVYWGDVTAPYKNFTTDFKAKHPFVAEENKDILNKIDRILTQTPSSSWGYQTVDPIEFFRYFTSDTKKAITQLEKIMDNEINKVKNYKKELEKKVELQEKITQYWNQNIKQKYGDFTKKFKEKNPIIAFEEASTLKKIDQIISQNPSPSWGTKTFNVVKALNYVKADINEAFEQIKNIIDAEKTKIENYKEELENMTTFHDETYKNLWSSTSAFKTSLDNSLLSDNPSLKKTITGCEERIEKLSLALAGIIFSDDTSQENIAVIDREFRFLLSFISMFNMQNNFEAYLSQKITPYTRISEYVTTRLSELKTAKKDEVKKITLELNDIKNNILDICLDNFESHDAKIPDDLKKLLLSPEKECLISTENGINKESTVKNIIKRAGQVITYADVLTPFYPKLKEEMDGLTQAMNDVIQYKDFSFSGISGTRYKNLETKIIKKIMAAFKCSSYATNRLLPKNASALKNDPTYKQIIAEFAMLPKKKSPGIFDLIVDLCKESTDFSPFAWLFGQKKELGLKGYLLSGTLNTIFGNKGAQIIRNSPKPQIIDTLREYILNQVYLEYINKTLDAQTFSTVPGLQNIQEKAKGNINYLSQKIKEYSSSLTTPSPGITGMVVNKIKESLSNVIRLPEDILANVNLILDSSLKQTNELYQSVGESTRYTISDFIEELTIPFLYTADEINLLLYKMAKKNAEFMKSEQKSFIKKKQKLLKKHNGSNTFVEEELKTYINKLPHVNAKLDKLAKAEENKLATQAAFLSVPKNTLTNIQTKSALNEARNAFIKNEIKLRKGYGTSLEEDRNSIKSLLNNITEEITSNKKQIDLIKNMPWWKRWFYTFTVNTLENENKIKISRQEKLKSKFSEMDKLMKTQYTKALDLNRLLNKQSVV